MREIQVCIKILALLVIISFTVVAIGREMLISAFAEKETVKYRMLVSDKKEENSAIAEVESVVMGKQRISMIRGEDKDIPFLCRGIKCNCRELGDYLLFSNSNQEMYFSNVTSMCVYYYYECDIGVAKYADNECIEEARLAVREAFSKAGSVEIKKIVQNSEDEKTVSYYVITDISDEAKIYVTLRRDTKNVVLYDGREIEKCILSQKNDSFN